MTRYVLAFILLLVVYGYSYGQVVHQSYPFPNDWGSTYAVTTDPSDNVIIAGSYCENSISQFNCPTNSIIRKYEPGGNLLWYAEVDNWGGIAKDVCTDHLGNVYVTGIFAGNEINLIGGPVITHPHGSQNCFLAKYSPSGVLQWAKVIGGNNNDGPSGLSCDPDGNVILAGHSSSTEISFSNTITLSNSTHFSFVTKYTPDGVVLWAIPVIVMGPASTHHQLIGLDVDNNGEIFITGSFDQILKIGTTNYPNATNGMFISRLDTAGTPIWTQRSTAPVPGSALAAGHSINVDNNGDVFVFGNYGPGNFSFAGQTFPPTLGTGTFTATWNCFVLKLDPAGNINWSLPIISNVAGGAPPFVPQVIKADGHGNCLITGPFYSSMTIDGQTFTGPAQGPQQAYEIFLAEIDSQGSLKWGSVGVSAAPISSETPTGIAFDSQDNCYLAGDILYGNGGPGSTSITFGGFTSTEQSGFLYRLKTGYRLNRLSGHIFYDTNLNGIKDAAESFASGTVALATPNFVYGNTQQNGQYQIFVDSGTYTVALPPRLYYNSAPASYTITLDSSGLSDSTLHFAWQPIPNMQDLMLTLTAGSPPRPGFSYPLYITYHNIGTISMTGSVDLSLDSLLQYQYSTPVASSVTGSNISWSFSNLQPGQSATIIAYSLVPASAVLGTMVSSSAVVNPLAGDLTTADNSVSVRQVVVGSCDPNDKQPSQHQLTPAEVADGKYLEYTIRFQNTGTDTAFTVRILDELSPLLNVSSIQMLSSSHPNTWELKGDGNLEWKFENILLPDSNTNEPASHGFIKFRVRPKTTLQLGAVIENTAHIYFDFNAAVITNTANTEVALVSAVADINNTEIQVYPNPNKGMFLVQLKNVKGQSVKAEIRNVLGQIVWKQTLSSENGNIHRQIIISNLNKGIYYLQVFSGKGKAVQKLVIE